MIWTYILFSGCFILLILIIFINIYNKYQNIFIKIDEAENNIDIILQKKLDYLIRSIPIIKDNLKDMDDFLVKSSSINIKELNNFEMNDQVKILQKEFNEVLDLNKNLNKIDSLNSLLKEMYDNENDLEGAKAYYNDNVTIYNNLVKKIPYSMIAKMYHYKHKEFYIDEKDEIFEILKNK
ncbi:MAG: LemA family protein [Bacilli bacterium]